MSARGAESRHRAAKPKAEADYYDERRRQSRELSRLNGVCGDSLAMEI